MNKRAIAKLTREPHLTHLTRVLPLIVGIFALQCYLVSQMNPEASVGNYAIFMAMSLGILIASLVYYDTKHLVLIFEDRLFIQNPLFNSQRVLMLDEISEVLTTDQEVNFASMIFKLKDGDKIYLYFVDYPQHVKKLIEELKTPREEDIAA